MREINELYKNAKKKKDKEVLLHNLKNIIGIIGQKRDQSVSALQECREENRGVSQQFDECIRAEKEHYQRIRAFEEACAKNEEILERLGE